MEINATQNIAFIALAFLTICFWSACWETLVLMAEHMYEPTDDKPNLRWYNRTPPFTAGKYRFWFLLLVLSFILLIVFYNSLADIIATVVPCEPFTMADGTVKTCRDTLIQGH